MPRAGSFPYCIVELRKAAHAMKTAPYQPRPASKWHVNRRGQHFLCCGVVKRGSGELE
jgi:hypothetical protein